MFPIPLTPFSDKQVFWQRIRDEPEILRLMGWTKSTPVELAKTIIMRKPTDDVTVASKKLISIFNTPGRKTGSVEFADCVIEVDITVAVGESKTADLVAQEVVRIMHNSTVNNRIVRLDTAMGDAQAPAGFYCHALRFNYFSSI